MFFQRHTSFSFSTESLFQFLHFIRLHQVVYQLTLVTIILFFSPPATSFQILAAFVLILLITPSFLLLQDVLGRKDDEKVGQKRILFSDRVNKIFFFSSIVLMVSILTLVNLLALFSYILLFASTLSYAVMKHYRQMFLAYCSRYLSSVFTFLVYLFLLVGSLFGPFIILLAIVSLLDLVGNIAGDIRDSQKDSIACVKTLVTTKGRVFSLQFMALLILCSFGLLFYMQQDLFFVLLFLCNVIPFVVIDSVPIRFAHGVFHASKILNYLFIAFIMSGFSFFLFFFVLLFIVLSWSFSYYFYLFPIN